MNDFSQQRFGSDPEVVSAFLDGLTQVDEIARPLGLYACEEYQMKDKPYLRHHQEWHLGIKPVLVAHGCTDLYPQIKEGLFSFKLPAGDCVRLQIARTSKVKVRMFGSRYRVDAQEQYPERWKSLHVDEMLWDLWRPTPGGWRADLRNVILIGFDSKPEPLEHELNELDRAVAWEKRGASYETHVWQDRYERGFNVRLSAWSYRKLEESST